MTQSELPIDFYRRAESEFSESLNNVNIEVSNFADSLNTMTKEVKNAVRNADSNTRNSFSKIVKYTILIGIAAFLIMIVAFEGYFLYYSLHIVSLLSAIISAVSSIFLIIGFFALSSIYIESALKNRGNGAGIVMSRLGSILAILEDRGIKAKSVTKIAAVLSGTFDRILSTRDKIKEFEEFKSGVKFSFSKYNILNDNIEKEIDSFSYFESDSDMETVWIDALAEHLSNLYLVHELRIPPNILKLIYLDYRNLSKKNTVWKEIWKKDSDIEVFSKILAASNLTNMSSLKDQVQTQKFLQLILKSLNDGYSLTFLIQRTTLYNELVHRIKWSLESVLVAIKSQLKVDNLPLDVPESLSSVEEYYLTILALKIHMSKDSTKFLFYNDFNKDKLADLVNKNEIEVIEVSDELVKLQLLKTKLPSEIIASIIKSHRERPLDFSALRDKIYMKEELIEIVRFSQPLLHDYGIETIGEEEVMNSIISSDEHDKLVAGNASDRVLGYAQLLERLAFTGKLNSKLRETLVHENEKGIYISSLTALMLNLRGNLSGRETNRELSSNPSLVEALYLFQKRTIDGNQRDFGILLADCVKKVLSGGISEIDGALVYKFGAILSDTGRITDYNFLLHSKVESSIEVFKRESAKIGENQLLREIISSILNKTWKVDDVRDMVLGNAVTAYMITRPQKPKDFKENSQLMTYIQESRIEEMRRIARKNIDPREVEGPPESLIMFRNAGTAVRIGLVPPGLSFDKFAKLFDSVVSEYLNDYNQSLPMHLTRVSASESSFYLTGAQYTDTSSFENQGILSKIKELVTTEKYISTNYQLALFSSLKLKKEQTLKETVIILFEQNKSTIFEHLSKGIYDTLLKACADKKISLNEFVEKLLKSVGVNSISEFIGLINRKDNDKDRKNLQQRIRQSVSSNLASGKEIAYEITVLSSDLTERMIAFSKAMREFGS